MMIFFSNLSNLLSEITSLAWIIFFSIIYIVLISFYNIIILILYIKRIKEYKKYKDQEKILISDFKSLPLVNIIIPTWKEGEIFKNLLFSIIKLSYPNIRVITNAGGNDETLQIANSFKNFENFVILHQKGGSDRPSLGKIKAINECLKYVSEGIIYFIDADSDINDEIFLRMIYPIINIGENIIIGGVQPLKNQIKKPLVKYLQFDRFKTLNRRFDRYFQSRVITGQNFCITYDVLKSFGEFSIQKLIPTDRSMGIDIFSKGYRAYRLVDYRHRIFVDYSESLKEYFHQRLIWNENYLYTSLKLHKIKNIFKFLSLWVISLYFLSFPILIFIDLRFFFPGIVIFFTIILKKLRRLFIYTKTVDKKYYDSYQISFLFYLIFYIIFDKIITFYVLVHFIVFLRKLKRTNVI